MTRTHEIKLDGYGAHTTLADDRPIMLLGTAESYGIEVLHIVPGNDWEGLTITATFNAADGSSTDILMDTDGNVVVPSEATAKSGGGKVVFTGVSDGVQRISCDLDYFVVAHSGINGTQTGGVAPSWFEQAAKRFMPEGGTAGQVLTKNTDADFDAEWQDSKGGSSLEMLQGTTDEITPTQVLVAFAKGQPILLTYVEDGIETAVFQSFELYPNDFIVSNIILGGGTFGNVYTVGVLMGDLSSNSWSFGDTDIISPDEIKKAINTALAQAKASGEFDGLDGITPTIGDNGNWFLGDTDTEKPSRGDDGKSAYEYAQDGGYTGTEDEFAAKLAAEIPSGGGASGLGIFDNYDVTLISFVLIDQDTLPIEAGIEITTDDNGNPFSYDGIVVWSDIKSGVSYTDIKFNGIQNFYFPFPHGVKNCMSVYVTDGKSMRAIRDGGSNVYIKQTRADINEAFFPVEYIADIPEKLTSVHLCPRNKVTTGTFYKIWGLTKK